MPDPTITSKNLPPIQQGAPSLAKPIEPEIVASIPYDQIEAKPLRSPNFINLLPKNPNMSLFWGNRAVGEKESGLRYDQLIAMGFVPAKPDQAYTRNPETGQKLPVPQSLCRDGRVMYGDLILLIIPRADYVGAQKWNEQSARRRVKKPGVVIEGAGASSDIGGREVVAQDGRAPMRGAGFPNNPKVSTFVPQLAEVDAKTADNSGPTNLADKT
jgi:hypothetical protein